MNIVMLTPTYPPTQGGVQTQVKLIAEELTRRGHNIAVITEEVENTTEMEVVEGINILRVRSPAVKIDPWRSYLFITHNSNTIKQVVKEEAADILHVQHANRSFAYAYLLNKHLAIPLIATIHVSWLADPLYQKWRWDFREPFRRTFKLLPGLWFDRNSIRSADFVITISKHFENVCKRIREDGNVVTIANAIDLTQFNPDVRPVELYGEEGYNILCPARISPEKGQLYLVDALKAVNESVKAHVYFMGSGTPAEEKKLKNRVRKRGLENYVHFIPPQPYDTISGVYKAADLIVLPSTSEGIPLVILENMALGNVVVASNVGGIPELIEHEETGLLAPPKNSEELAVLITKALVDERLRKRIKRNATAEAYERFDVKKNAERIEQVYRTVLDTNSFKV